MSKSDDEEIKRFLKEFESDISEETFIWAKKKDHSKISPELKDLLWGLPVLTSNVFNIFSDLKRNAKKIIISEEYFYKRAVIAQYYGKTSKTIYYLKKEIKFLTKLLQDNPVELKFKDNKMLIVNYKSYKAELSLEFNIGERISKIGILIFNISEKIIENQAYEDLLSYYNSLKEKYFKIVRERCS